MERFMYRDESFEGTLKEKADEYRMYPSQQVWENIQKQIKRRNSGFHFKSLGLSTLLLLGFAITTGDDEYNKELFSTTSLQQPATNQDETEFSSTTQAPVVSINTVVTKKINAGFSVTSASTSPFADVAVVEPAFTGADDVTEKTVLTAAPTTESIKKITADNRLMSLDPAQHFNQVKATDLTAITPAPAAEITTPLAETGPSGLTDAELNYEVNVPVITQQALKKQIQFYLTSGASYRVLYNDKQLTFGNLQNQDPENVARHRPSIGFEAGTAILFPITKAVKFRTGVQFNYTRYNVEVFKANPQVATISFASSGIVQRISALRTDSGRLSMVKNETLQIAIPIGLEFKLAGKKSIQWHMASNIQPAYLISASGYFLTNDLKKYVKAPDLLSNLNLNSALETFIRWNMKDVQLQAGPQLRYQLFSNTRGDYQIKEHLVDYGFRIGLVKTLR